MTAIEKPEQTAVNNRRTQSPQSTKRTQPCSWIVRDKVGGLWGPFDGFQAAIDWATPKWPDVPQYDPIFDDSPDGCWEAEAVQPPDRA